MGIAPPLPWPPAGGAEVELAPGLRCRAAREVETRVTLDASERRAFDERVQRRAGAPLLLTLVDERFKIPGFGGSARIRAVTSAGADAPRYEWSVKEDRSVGAFRVVKAPIEYEGEARSSDDARRALTTIMAHLGHGADMVQTELRHHDRMVYALQHDGRTVVINADTFTHIRRAGEDGAVPEHSVEFELQLGPDATDEEVQRAEEVLIAAAASLGISADRLHPKRRAPRGAASAEAV